MKEITLPKELFNLPYPWGLALREQRSQQMDLLSYEFNSIKTALNVLERSLCGLSQLTLAEDDSIPEDMITYWPFTAELLAIEIPTLDEFDLLKVEQFLMEEPGMGPPSPDLIFDVAAYWVWWVTWSIEKAALYWVEKALMKNREPILISRFLHIVFRYWQKIEPRFAQSLLSASAMIGWQKALPLFDVVEQDPEASPEVKKTVRNYRELVLDNPEKWLPDSDAAEELAEKKVSFVPRRPALRQLTHV